MMTDRPLRIGYVMQNGAPDLATISGPQLHVTAVIRGLQRRGHQVRTIAIQNDRLQWTDDLQTWHPADYGRSRAHVVRVVESALRRLQSELRLPFLNLFDSIHYADACVQLLEGTHLLYERHGYLGYGGLLAARRMKIPLFLELNGNIVKEIDEMAVPMSSTQRAIGRGITAWTLRKADRVVAVSNALKEEIVRNLRVPSENVSVVLNGVDLELFSREGDPASARGRYALGDGPLVVFVGTFQPWHGVEVLVSAFSSVVSRFPLARLVLVGDGAGRDAIVERVRQSGIESRAILTGRLPQSEVAGIVQAADVAVAPYGLPTADIVGTPLKIIEYMAAGKAIVASTAPYHEVLVNEVTGLRVAPAAAAPLADAITRLLEDAALRARLGAAARLEARRYSWDAVVGRLCEIFEAQLSPRR